MYPSASEGADVNSKTKRVKLRVDNRHAPLSPAAAKTHPPTHPLVQPRCRYPPRLESHVAPRAHGHIIQQWASLGTAAAPSGMIKLQGNQYYEILAAAKANSADAVLTSKFQLQWASRSHAQSIVPSSRLFLSRHVSGSPFPLRVIPNIASAATMRVFKSGVSMATAGVMASFTVQSRDSYDNVRSVDFVEGLGRLLDWTIASPPDASPRSHGTATYIGAGQYQYNHTTVITGAPSVQGMLLSAGGLNGTYYENEEP